MNSMIMSENTAKHEGKSVSHFEDGSGKKLTDLTMLTDFHIVFTDGSRINMAPDWRGAECYWSQRQPQAEVDGKVTKSVKTMSENIDLDRIILRDWNEYLKACDENPLYINITEPALRPGEWVKVKDTIAFVCTSHRVSTPQQPLMLYDPALGTKEPYPSHAGQYREYHGSVAWLFNPWTGNQRNPFDIGSDVTGLLIKESSDG